MSDTLRRGRSIIEWSFAASALERESGDLHVVLPLATGVVVAVLDGLGHGPEAAVAAKAGADILVAHAGESLESLVQRCHDGLRATRGVVMSVASFNVRDSTLTWIGVGNVETVLLRSDRGSRPAREAITLRGGIVGYRLPPLRPKTLPVFPGDVMIMATDGVKTDFTAGLAMDGSPTSIAESILATHSRGSDDALVLVAKYVGGTPEGTEERMRC